MTATILQAEQHCLNQSEHGPAFGPDECQMQCHNAYDIPTDGTPDATTGWRKARDRHPATDPRATPRGAFNHWVGGSAGRGHVTISRDAGGPDWSTDADWSGGKGTGFWNNVDPRTITEHWTSLRYVGWSWDIDGVSVKPHTAPPPAKHPHIKAAVTATKIALGKQHPGSKRRSHIVTALSELLRALAGK